MSLVIHIGMQKTGTTFLQAALHKSRDQLLKHNIIYQSPTAGLSGQKEREAAHHWLAHAIQGTRKLYTPPADFALLNDHVAALRAASLEARGVSIISSEEFSSFNTRSIKRLRRLFPDKDTRILVYLRRQDLWLDSLYAQLVKVGRQTSVEEVFSKERWRLDYLKWLDAWAGYFGSQNVIVRVYEGFTESTSLWNDFFHAIGKPEASAIVPSIETANPSLAYELTLFSKAQHIYGEQRGLRHLLERVNGNFPQHIGLKYIPADMAKDIIASSAETNRGVARKYLGRDTLFQNETITSGQANGGLSNEQLAQVVGGISILLVSRISKLEARIQELEKKASKPPADFPLLYASDSRLPATAPYTIQSREMACCFYKLIPRCTAVYFSPSSKVDPMGDFGHQGLTTPRHTQVLPAPSGWIDWMRPEQPAFRRFLSGQPRNTIVYTQGARLSRTSISCGFKTFIELSSRPNHFRATLLRDFFESGRLVGLITPTARLKADLLALVPHLTADRVYVAGLAASADLLEWRPQSIPAGGSFNVGYAGSAFEGNGMHILLLCASRMPDVRFHIIGHERTACPPKLARANVIFHGRRPHPETIGLLKSMDALVLPGRKPVLVKISEGSGTRNSPLKLCEYLATGRPLIAADLPVFRGVLKEGENALLAPPEDVEGFCRQVKRLQDYPVLRHALGQKARLDFAANHTWEHRARRILEFMAKQAMVAA